MLGQRLTRQLADGGPMIYWATLEPRDGEDRATSAAIWRSGTAGASGPWSGAGLAGGPGAGARESAVLFDSVTACLACRCSPARSPDAAAAARTARELLTVSRHPRHFVCVCDELWRDGVTYEPWTEHYRRGLAEICRALAGGI